MKKTIILSGIWILGLSFHLFALDITADSRIAEVTLYPDSALISRRAAVKLNPGEYSVILADIVPEIDENSLRVSAKGSAEAKLFGAKIKREFLEQVPSERIKQLKDELQRLEDEKRKLEDNKAILNKEKDFLDSIRLYANVQVPKDLATKMPQAQDLDAMLKFLDAKLKENYSAYLECELKMRGIADKADTLKRQLAEISGSVRKLKRSIVVELEAVKGGELDLNVSYLVMGASWQPIYDARADFQKSLVELVSYGIVKQNTGEDWPDVEISLSTARPAIGGRMPYINPWVLRPSQPRVIMERLSKASALAPDMQYEALDEAGLELEEKAVVPKYSAPQEKGIAVVYKLLHKASINSDGSEHKLAVSSQDLKADFEYSSYPRSALYAYLGSRVSNAKDLQLLAGRVNIFLEGDFVGTSSIDNIGQGEEFDLYLGADENVKVKREQIEKKVDETLVVGIPSRTKSTVFKHKLTVENYKSKKIKLKLFDAMPVSEDDRIKVKMGQAGLEPKEKDWKDRKGIWLWELELEPKAKREIIYSYTVEHPREMMVEGL